MRLYDRGITVLGAEMQPAPQPSKKMWAIFGVAVGGLAVAALLTSNERGLKRSKKR